MKKVKEFNSREEHLLDWWTSQTDEPFPQPLLDGFRELNINEIISKDGFSFSFHIPYEDTTISVEVWNSDENKMAIKTLFSSELDLIKNCPEVNFPVHLTSRDKAGNCPLDLMKDEEIKVLAYLPLMFYEVVEKIWSDDVDIFEYHTLAESTTIQEELRALLYNCPSLSLSDVLEKVDHYESDTKNHKGEKVAYTLFKGELRFPGNRLTQRAENVPVTFVRTFDVSTDRMFWLEVYNSITRAKDAAACLLRMPEDLIPHLTQLTRQGEEYMAEFNLPGESKEFKTKMKSKLVYLDGETYYDKLIFET